MPLRLLYVMDPMTRVLVDKDTTFAFQLEGERRSHEQYHCLPGDLYVVHARPHAAARRLSVRRGTPHFALHETRAVPLTFFDVVFMRNVLIYFSGACKHAMQAKTRRVLRPEGPLVAGATETLELHSDEFDVVRHGRSTFYSVKED